MAKLLVTASLVTQSAPATPSAGFGTLYASGSGLYFKNSSGTNYDLSVVGSSSFTAFTSSGTWTYTTGSNIQYIKVLCAGGGGGGGGGRLGATSSLRSPGGGGAGGSISIAYFSSQSLRTGSYTVTVGGGGSGGTNATGTTGLNGGNGVAGSDSTFASGSTILLRGVGGALGGFGNAAANGTGGTNTAPTTASVPNPYPPFYYSGRNGSTGPANAGNAFDGTRFLAGGGGGGSINASNVSSAGASGSAVYQYATLIQSGSPGGINNAGQDGAPVFDIINFLTYYTGSSLSTGVLVGTGGHGGGSGTNSPTASAGNGGSGSRAAGGGGGGGTVTGTGISSGRGGPGGSGFVIIFEYY
jgi:hypothetical protein